ncbi:MAG: hypothetical protein RMJ98_09985 [Myxococcales bacterium]|nr:hypothetical protein [Polyangiaceae bacterium]MDW8249618.1 hypothetical protein [Myxococcales bacterium]
MPPLAALRYRSLALLALALLALGAFSCQRTGVALVKLMPGVTNDPRNRTMRREIMSFGSKEFCKELMKRGAPLKTRDDAPAMGRFFADQCFHQDMENDDVFVQFSGRGYTWTQPSGRIGFKIQGSILYNPDFLLHGKTMYAYFRPRTVQSSKFETIMIERVGSTPLGGLFGASAQDTANRMGNQIIAQELQRGFTVLRDDDGSVDFGVGIIEQGQRPFHPYQVHGSDKVLLASDWTEIHEQQRDFLGPFEIEGRDQALFLTMNLDGTPAVDVMLFQKTPGDGWLQTYIQQAQVGPPPVPPMLSDVLAQGREWRRTVPLKPGLYYLVIDHTSVAGPVSPPPSQPGFLGTSDVAAVVRYVAQVGDAP